ncbi:MAG TPA: DUF4870 domain-containing protein [Anaerohalosphaeraceae bacterium]|jgi:hypothetical protein|nr:DUF4870 domain-containing protein [Anaerohalosphaeraceae bacterium]HOT72082.1 DUF4870 domain-containing protein [Anaerohalosphaeraceae bacterium]HPB92808.1 DUF4870 domain-containing protein [Anaerohalosphaeraceae bacterium]HQG05428.1 DUF4870 domain-containing protein [Anaerohalosphaeraceae bacterium]HQI06801.1 DUF4870 domain-containing protein [Anaerohalosphaeraceae bacterium]
MDEQGTENQHQTFAEGGSPVLSKDSLNLAILCHLLGMFTSFLGPLILWLVKKDEDEYVEHHSREALNFQITLLLGYYAGCLLSFVCIGVLVILAVLAMNFIFCLTAAVAASKGQRYQYPFCLRLVK